MVRVIGVRLPFPASVALLQSLEEVVAGTLNGEIDQRGRATKQGGTGDLLRWGGLHAGKAHDGRGNVGMRLDASWNDDPAASVNDLSDVARERAWCRDGDDLLSLK